jgi:hypothetical protein
MLVGLDPGAHAFVNEDGKALDLPPNAVATALALAYEAISGADDVRGTMVVLGTERDELGARTAKSADVPDATVRLAFNIARP